MRLTTRTIKQTLGELLPKFALRGGFQFFKGCDANCHENPNVM